MKSKKPLIVTYKGEAVNLWDFYDDRGNVLVEPGHVWDDDLDLSGLNLSDNENLEVIEKEMPDLSFLHVTGSVDISSNSQLKYLSKLPQQIDGNLIANHCSGIKSLDGIPSVGKNAYFVGCSMEYQAYLLARRSLNGNDNLLDNYALLDGEIDCKSLPVRGKVFTPVAYVRWQWETQEKIISLTEKAFAPDGKNKELATRSLHWYREWTNKNDPQTVHIAKQMAKSNEELKAFAEEKDKRRTASRIESIRRAKEEAQKEAQSELNKALSANHTQNTAGAKEWANRQLSGNEGPCQSKRKVKHKEESPAVAEGKGLIETLKNLQKGTLSLDVSKEEVTQYVVDIRALKQRIDNYDRKQDKDSFPSLVKLLELKKKFLFMAVKDNNVPNLSSKLRKEALKIVGYQGYDQREQAKKERKEQKAIAARIYESKRAKYVQVQPTQQMPKKENQFKLPRKMKKTLVETLRKLYALAITLDTRSAHVATGISINLLAAVQNNNQRK